MVAYGQKRHLGDCCITWCPRLSVPFPVPRPRVLSYPAVLLGGVPGERRGSNVLTNVRPCGLLGLRRTTVRGGAGLAACTRGTFRRGSASNRRGVDPAGRSEGKLSATPGPGEGRGSGHRRSSVRAAWPGPSDEGRLRVKARAPRERSEGHEKEARNVQHDRASTSGPPG